MSLKTEYNIRKWDDDFIQPRALLFTAAMGILSLEIVSHLRGVQYSKYSLLLGKTLLPLEMVAS